jgi:sulfide:quinone oxidoreductase
MNLAEDWFRRQGLLKDAEVVFATALPKMFGVAKYCKTSEKHVVERGIQALFRHNLISLNPEKKEATFDHLETKEKRVMPSVTQVACPLPRPEPRCVSRLPHWSPIFLRSLSGKLPTAKYDGYTIVSNPD